MNPQDIIVLEQTESTNNYAMAAVQRKIINHGTGVFAMEQTAGRGRRGKAWLTERGQNILLSIPLEMRWQPVTQQFGLSAAIALAVRDFIVQHVSAEVAVKWPNDIFIADRKAAGILIENVLAGTLWQWAVVGIGINVNQKQFGSVDAAVTSMSLESGEEFDVLGLAHELRLHILRRVQDLKSGLFSDMLTEYNEHLYAKNCKVRLKQGAVVFETEIWKVGATGQLHTVDATERIFNFDEVTFRGKVG